ncbi:MAG: sulfatase [Verrucomicrobiia bacterium]|jgi:arylsulfatase A-like enzyme
MKRFHAFYLLPLLATAVVFGSLDKARAAAPIKQPNVLFIAIDDLNDWIGVLGGHPQARTPNLDRLARRSVLFANTHCAAPACNPSRAALMTGIPPYKSGVYTNPQPWRRGLPDAVTIPQYFSAQGYWSAGSGKIYHGAFPDPASWDAYYPDQKKNKFPDPNPPKKNINGLKRGHFDWGPLTAPASEMGDYKTATWISEQLTRQHNKPFFLACGIYRPHLPWYAPQKYFDMFPLDSIQLPKTLADDLKDVPPAGRKMAKPTGDHAAVVKGKQWKQAVQGYLASIAFADAQVGRVIAALDAGPHHKNTIVVLWTDHGWHLGEKEHWRKFALWNRATRTPLMISVPQGVKGFPEGSVRNRQCQEATSLLDIYPTLIDLCGLPKRNDLTGESLVPQLMNPDLKTDRAVITTHGRNNHAIRDARWRYIRYADGGEELYDHQNDSNEWTNLASDPAHAATMKRLAKSLPKVNVPDSPRSKKR